MKSSKQPQGDAVRLNRHNITRAKSARSLKVGCRHAEQANLHGISMMQVFTHEENSAGRCRLSFTCLATSVVEMGKSNGMHLHSIILPPIVCGAKLQRGTFSLTTVRSDVILDDFGVGYFGGHTFMREKHLLQ